MNRARVINRNTDEMILNEVNVADTFFRRFKGLMGVKELKEGESILILPCNSVHSFFMKFNFDVVFIDKSGKVINVIYSMKPWKCSPIIKESKYVIETSGDYLVEKLKVDDEIEVKYI